MSYLRSKTWKIFKAAILNGISEIPAVGIINDSRKPSGKPSGKSSTKFIISIWIWILMIRCFPRLTGLQTFSSIHTALAKAAPRGFSL